MSEKNVNKFFLVFFFTLISIFNVKSITIDSLENQYNLPYPYISNSSSGLFMKQPSNLNFKTIYDPVTNQYLIQKRLGEYKLGKPEILSFEEFQKWKVYALEIGYGVCESGPLIRSSYHAEEQSEKFDVLNRRKTLMASL